MSINSSKIYCYPKDLQIQFPEGLDEIRFLEEIGNFNYLSIKQSESNRIDLPQEFTEATLPDDFLKKIRQNQYEQAKIFRKDQQFKNIIYNDIELSASKMARQNMALIVAVASDIKTKHYWQDIQKDPQEFTGEDFKEILKIISNRDSKLYYIEAQVKKDIDAKFSPSSLQPFDLSQSWQNHEEAYSQN